MAKIRVNHGISTLNIKDESSGGNLKLFLEKSSGSAPPIYANTAGMYMEVIPYNRM